MKLIQPADFLNKVLWSLPREKFVYFTGAFAFHKAIHAETEMGYHIETLSHLALRLEEEKQILLVLQRKEDFLYDYIAIKRTRPPSISLPLLNSVKESQDAFDSHNGFQGFRKIRTRKAVGRQTRVR